MIYVINCLVAFEWFGFCFSLKPRTDPRYIQVVFLSDLLCWNRYATASARSDGLLLLCGGRDASSVVSMHKLAFSFDVLSL